MEIEKESFKDPYSKFTFFILHTLYPKGFLVAELEGKIVGYVSLVKFGRRASLISIAVAKDFRRKGIGEKLLKKVLLDLKVDKVTLEVRVSNLAAINLYKKMGFKEVKIIKGYYSDGEDALKMELKK